MSFVSLSLSETYDRSNASRKPILAIRSWVSKIGLIIVSTIECLPAKSAVADEDQEQLDTKSKSLYSRGGFVEMFRLSMS